MITKDGKLRKISTNEYGKTAAAWSAKPKAIRKILKTVTSIGTEAQQTCALMQALHNKDILPRATMLG